jgi:hypothetical protein
MLKLWPVFLLAPGIGFLFLFFLGDKNKALLWPAGILTLLGLLFILRYLEYLRYWPVILIVFGIVLIFWKKRRAVEKESDQ